MAHTSTAVLLETNCEPAQASTVQDPMNAWWNSLPTWNETSERVQELTKNLPSWNETTELVQEASKTTVETVRKSTASSLRDAADSIEEASKNTAAKMRDAAPWVAGEDDPPHPLLRMEDLRKGDMVFRKALPAEVMHVGQGEIVVRMQDSNADISTQCEYVSLSVDASQQFLGLGVRVCLVGLQNRPELNGCHGSMIEFNPEVQRWNVKLDATIEIIRANPRNLSALLAPPTPGATSQQSISVGMRVRLEGLQNRPELNGRQGTIMKRVAQDERWHVQIESTNEVIGVNARNISLHGVTV